MVNNDIWRVGSENYKFLDAIKKAYRELKGIELSQRQVIDAIRKNPNILKSDKLKRFFNGQ